MLSWRLCTSGEASVLISVKFKPDLTSFSQIMDDMYISRKLYGEIPSFLESCEPRASKCPTISPICAGYGKKKKGRRVVHSRHDVNQIKGLLRSNSPFF